jgi:hypothetical protein
MADWKLEYLHEKVRQALESLVLTSDPQDLAGAFEILGRIRNDEADIDDEQAQGWWKTVCELKAVAPQDFDEAQKDGCSPDEARAARLMGSEQKHAFVSALCELDGYLTNQYYQHYGTDD